MKSIIHIMLSLCLIQQVSALDSLFILGESYNRIAIDYPSQSEEISRRLLVGKYDTDAADYYFSVVRSCREKINDANISDRLNPGSCHCAAWIDLIRFNNASPDTSIRAMILEQWDAGFDKKHDRLIPLSQILALQAAWSPGLATEKMWSFIERSKLDDHALEAICYASFASLDHIAWLHLEKLEKATVDPARNAMINKTMSWIRHEMFKGLALDSAVGPAFHKPSFVDITMLTTLKR